MPQPALFRTRRGATGQQYAIMLGLIAVVALFSVASLGTTVTRLFSGVGNSIGGVGNAAIGGGSGSGGGGGGPAPVAYLAWGRGNIRQLGTDSTDNSATPTPMSELAGLNGIAEVVPGNGIGYARTSAGAVYSWGFNLWGSLGDGTNTDSGVPVQVRGLGGSGTLSGVTALGARNSVSPCALISGGQVVCWGSGGNGALGNNSSANSNVPVQVLGVGGSGLLSGIVQLETGGPACAVNGSGSVFCWGWNGFGQLGINSTTTSMTPAQVTGVGGSGFLSGINEVSTPNGTHACARGGGSVWCWGRNIYGQLGDNSTTQRNAPVQVRGVGNVGTLANITQITVGGSASCALASDASAYCWGYGGYGQVGDGSYTDRLTPVQVKGVGNVGTLSGVVQISAGNYMTCARSSSAAFCWGANDNGQLGDGTTTYANAPVRVLGVGGSGFLGAVSSLLSGDTHVYVSP